ncbi:glutamate/tyrosine decarboxylase-like PLP-dependent enzyme [Kibdelosporangium banguiense]|uniref:Glutamate/tyrosine decarboxylase-like PLP-dependent enzyme n=1 Tax=Kibdelosporangium banguiense TaxID=1365924 RepID=A0ABS4TV45_9PSEU|nr:hypothetical protein [Kibdelosporangium banguiense]MBP2328281.1 glutamate/tyrosine decarboxylase-like PLP-dependent enzyme [Kibdelosporangium banguiense]
MAERQVRLGGTAQVELFGSRHEFRVSVGLATQLSTMEDFEVLGEVQTAVCCTRFLPAELRDAPGPVQDEVQQRLQQRIERGGRAWPATTVLRGRRVLRININSVLTRAEHVDELLALLQREAGAVLAELSLSRHVQ